MSETLPNYEQELDLIRCELEGKTVRGCPVFRIQGVSLTGPKGSTGCRTILVGINTVEAAAALAKFNFDREAFNEAALAVAKGIIGKYTPTMKLRHYRVQLA